MIGGALRGMRRRAGVTVGLFLVAVVGAAAAAAGPAYDAAARTSTLRDDLTTTLPLERTAEVTITGQAADQGGYTAGVISDTVAGQLGGRSALNRMFQQVVAVSAATGPSIEGVQTPISANTGVCAQLRIVTGTCPVSSGQVLVSTSFATAFGVRPGSVLTAASYPRLTVTGEYTIPPASALTGTYWLAGGCDDFTHEAPCQQGAPLLGPSSRQRPDALFTPASTFDEISDPVVQVQVSVLEVLSPAGVRGGDLPVLTAAMNELGTDPGLQSLNATFVTSIPQLTAQITAAWNTLDVPVFLIACQVLVLAWLLLFLIGTDAAESRAGEVALAKLRGHGRLRTVAFGLSEPVIVFLLAFPVGALAGWAAVGGLRHLLLRPGTPVGLPWLAIAAAAAATLGGFASTVLAARRALVRPVTEQWQHASRTATSRGWVLDAILLTGAVAGVAELYIGGYVSSARAGSLALLLPGLVGLAAAVVTSRLLPQVCRLLYQVTRRRGSTGLFLAIRHIARRPGGTRTTIVLTAAFALAAFAVAAFAVDERNIDRMAAAQAGADTVLTVQAPPGHDLGTIVDRIDPGGGQAAAVDRLVSATANGAVLLAVQPQRFARVADWQPGFLSQKPATVGSAISPPAPGSPVTFPGSATAVRVQVSDAHGLPDGAVLDIWVHQASEPSSEGGQTPVSLGVIHDGLLTASLTECPCEVSMLTIETQSAVSHQVSGSLTLSGLATLSGGTWTPVPGPLASVAGWRAGPEFPSGCSASTGQLVAVPGGLEWQAGFTGLCSPALFRQDRPDPLPVLAASSLTGGSRQDFNALGLGGLQASFRPVALAGAIPGAPATGIVVDRTYAQRAAGFVTDGLVDEEVWVAPGALPGIQARLTAAGVTILNQTTLSGTRALLLRQGPALASVLFLAAAAAAVLLAAGAAILSLYQAGRRRRYEYAALIAGRVSRRSVRSSLLIEQAAVLGFGAVAGVAAGLGSAALVLRNLPVFITRPAAPSLLTAPPAGQVLIWLVIALALLAAAAVTASAALLGSVRPELLREVPP
jgi:putative ABC transport system permease protein